MQVKSSTSSQSETRNQREPIRPWTPICAVLCLLVGSLAGCGADQQTQSEKEEDESRAAEEERARKPKLVGTWETNIGAGIKYKFTFRRSGEVLGVNPLTGRDVVMFVVSAVDGDTVILRHILEANDENASEGKVEFLDADSVEMWPPSSLQNLKETSYTLKRLSGSSSEQGAALKLPVGAQRVVGIWDTQIQGVGTYRMDLMPDGAMHYETSLGQASQAQWNYKGMDGKTVLIETGPSDDKMGVARVKFLSDDKMIMSEEDDTNAMTFTRLEGLIE